MRVFKTQEEPSHLTDFTGEFELLTLTWINEEHVEQGYQKCPGPVRPVCRLLTHHALALFRKRDQNRDVFVFLFSQFALRCPGRSMRQKKISEDLTTLIRV